MYRLAFALVLFAALGLTVLVYLQRGTIAAQEVRLAALDAQLSAAQALPKPASLEVQAKCFEQARKFFAQSGYRTVAGDDLTNHFATKLNRCFLEVLQTKSQGETIWTHRFVFDAFEGRLYGSFGWHSDPVKKYRDVAPMMCEVYSLDGTKATCHSDEEFTEMTKVYMQTD